MDRDIAHKTKVSFGVWHCTLLIVDFSVSTRVAMNNDLAGVLSTIG